MIHKASIGFLLAAAAALCACASVAQREQLSQRQWEQVATTLEVDGTADALVTAALVRRSALADAGAALTDLDRALQLDPKQPDAAWLALNICAEIHDCSSAPRSARLLALDPRNASARFATLKEASNTGDAAAEDRALAAMADAQYFDVYWSRLLTRTVDVLAQPRGSAHRPLREPMLAGTEVIGWLAAVAIPPFSATSNSCKGDRLKRDDVIDWCRNLAAVFDNGDTYIAQSLGRSIASRVWTAESTEFARFREHQREYQYVQETIQPYDLTVHTTVEGMQRWIDRYRANRSEHDAYRQWLTDLGIPPDPPADWQPGRRRVADR